MQNRTLGGAVALLASLLAQPALADDTATAPDASSDSGEPIVVEPVQLHPAAGMMNEHMHSGGEFMFGLRWTHSSFSGANQSGTEIIADADIVAAGYHARPKRMEMDMVMLDIMYAPNDKLTLMVMPHWMRHEMTMLGIDPAITNDGDMGGDGDMGHAHHTLPHGQTMTHSSEGMGDTLVSASWRLARSGTFNAHATLGLWVPTGSVSRKNADGTFVHYGMQGGSGTWDIAPSVTVSAGSGALGWGAQAGYVWRTESENKSGFAFGDEAMATGWASYAASNDLSFTGRVAWEHEGQILGHYNAGHNHAAPPDRQANYGGDTVLLAAGLNYALPVGGVHRPQIGVEAGIPLYQDLNGIQLPEDWRLSVSLSRTF